MTHTPGTPIYVDCTRPLDPPPTDQIETLMNNERDCAACGCDIDDHWGEYQPEDPDCLDEPIWTGARLGRIPTAGCVCDDCPGYKAPR
jgi:hypothetical protein